MVGLHCERAGKYVARKKEGLGPEGQRNRGSKKIGCQARININFPPQYGYRYLSKVDLQHCHPIMEANEANKRFLEPLTEKEFDIIDSMARMNFNRSQIIQVITDGYFGHADFY